MSNKANTYLLQANGIIGVAFTRSWIEGIRSLRSHCVTRDYPVVLLNVLTILDLILDSGDGPALMKALSALERLNKTLNTKRHPSLKEIREIAQAADEARGRRK